MIIPICDLEKVRKLRNLLDSGLENGRKYDLDAISEICQQAVNDEDLEIIDEDSIDDSIVESLLYGRPPKFDKISKDQFLSLFSDVLDDGYSQAQQQWVFEMIEIMFSLPDSFVVNEIFFQNTPIEVLWEKVNAYRPILL